MKAKKVIALVMCAAMVAGMGWILPRTDQFSTSRSYLSWLFGKKKEYNLSGETFQNSSGSAGNRL